MVEVMMMWQSMSAWYTPTVLFCVANFIIATIFIASNKHPDSNSNSFIPIIPIIPIARVYSFLDRIKSIKLSSSEDSQHQHQPPEPPQLIKTATYTSMSRLAQSIFTPSKHVTAVTTSPSELPNSASPSQLDRVDSVVEPEEPSQLVRVPSFFDRVKSFKINSSVMKKSRSEVRIGGDDDGEDDVDIRRPETARASTRHDDVDVKADDFISRFKQQLKLQRLESLVRFNDMLNRRR